MNDKIFKSFREKTQNQNQSEYFSCDNSISYQNILGRKRQSTKKLFRYDNDLIDKFTVKISEKSKILFT